MTALSNDPLFPPRFGIFFKFAAPRRVSAPELPHVETETVNVPPPEPSSPAASPAARPEERAAESKETALAPESASEDAIRWAHESAPAALATPEPEMPVESEVKASFAAESSPGPEPVAPTDVPDSSVAAEPAAPTELRESSAAADLAELAQPTESAELAAPASLSAPVPVPRAPLGIMGLSFGDLLRRKGAW